MNLFQLGDFTLASGMRSAWKIDCDALADDDIAALAKMIADMVKPFGSAEGVPRGGLRLAEALRHHVCPALTFAPLPHLIVDDVLTTGGSMERLRYERGGVGGIRGDGARIIGAVIFARGPCPGWIKPLFQMPTEGT